MREVKLSLQAYLLFRSESEEAGVALDLAGGGGWIGAVDIGFARFSQLPALLQLIQRNLWVPRRAHHPDAVVLHQRFAVLVGGEVNSEIGKAAEESEKREQQQRRVERELQQLKAA